LAGLIVINHGGPDWHHFIVENTRQHAPPLVPEVVLHLADESVPIWQKTEAELGEMNVAPPYWAFAWAGGQALARHVLDNPNLVTNKTVLDVGSGSGLGAIACMKAGARAALAVDIDPIAGIAALMNAEANNVTIAVSADDMLPEAQTLAQCARDVILIGDLFYERPLAERVLAAITLAASRGARVLTGDPQRSYFPRERFTQIAEYRVPVTRELEDAEIKRTAVWSLRH
jgi:predicted nicotinamide N-methyase